MTADDLTDAERSWSIPWNGHSVYLEHDVKRIVAAREAAARAELATLRERVKAEVFGENAQAVLYGVTGTHPESYGGVTKDEALEYAGELVEAVRAALAPSEGGG